MEIIKSYYIPVESSNRDENNLKIEVYYDLGKYDYYTHKSNKRGYYVSVTPVTRCKRDNYFTEISTVFVGYKYCLKEVSRKTNKATQEALELSENINWLIEHICDEYGFEIVEKK